MISNTTPIAPDEAYFAAWLRLQAVSDILGQLSDDQISHLDNAVPIWRSYANGLSRDEAQENHEAIWLAERLAGFRAEKLTAEEIAELDNHPYIGPSWRSLV